MFIQSLLIWALQIFLIALFGRVILDYIRIFSPSWRPRGIILVLAEFVYGITDPVIKAVRKVIPPLRMGPVAIDLGFIVIFIGVQLLISLLRTLTF
jgi:YggT family protein